MIHEAIATGSTIDEAIANAKAQLGAWNMISSVRGTNAI